MKEQIANRLGVAHVRDTVKQFVAGSVTREQAMESLQIGQSRLYDLRTSYLAAKAAGDGETWEPGRSGGNHKPTWPDEEQRFLRRALSPCGESKRYSYAFAASELGRRFGHEVDRGQVRHWAMENGIKVAVPGPRPLAHVRRWQRKAIGELWQLDATPDRFLGRGRPSYQLLDMLDDCSRVQVGSASISASASSHIWTCFTGLFRATGCRLRSMWTRRGSSGARTASSPSGAGD